MDDDTAAATWSRKLTELCKLVGARCWSAASAVACDETCLAESGITTDTPVGRPWLMSSHWVDR